MNLVASPKVAWQLLARIPATAIVAMAALGVAMVPFAGEALQYDRTSIAAREVWRAVTCHVTHWNAEHLQWDLLMFVVLGAMCEWRNRKSMWFCLALGAAAVSGTVLVFFPNVSEYRGLSGIDTSLFTLLALEMIRDARREKNVLQALATGGLLLGLAAKTAYEATSGQTIFVEEQAAGFVPLVWDHVAGAAAGTIVWLTNQRLPSKGSITAKAASIPSKGMAAGSLSAPFLDRSSDIDWMASSSETLSSAKSKRSDDCWDINERSSVVVSIRSKLELAG